MVNKSFDPVASITDLHPIQKYFLRDAHWPLQTEMNNGRPLVHPPFPFDLVVSAVDWTPAITNSYCLLHQNLRNS